LGGAAGILAFFAFSAGTTAGFISGAVLFEVFYILDNCDGEVARASGLSSKLGSWMDTVVDCCVHTLSFVGIGLGVARVTQDPIMLFLGIAAGIGTFLSTFVAMLQKVMNYGLAIHGMPKAPEGETKRITVADRLIEIFSSGDFSLVVLLFAILNKMELLLWLGAIGANIFCIVLLAVNFKYLAGRR
jgi:phosphatidylglycerophosphate synthase